METIVEELVSNEAYTFH